MEHSVPDWISKDFFTKLIQQEKCNQNIVVTNSFTSPAVPPGNNYGSNIIRVKVEYNDGKADTGLQYLSLIIKAELTEGLLKEKFDMQDFSEPAFYSKFLPKAKKITNVSFVPKHFLSPRPNTIILEDLKEQGFVMADRMKMLDFEHCRLYMIAAASLHAVSFAVHKVDPDIVESIGKEKMFSSELKGHEMFKFLIKFGMKCLINSIEKMEKFKKYCTIIQDTSPILWDMLVEAHMPNNEVMKTINQGDPWTTNMMFKYDNKGHVCDVKLLDFQVLRYGSPVNDVMFFVWASANHDVKKNKLEDLYQIYIETLNNKLREFNCTERLTHEQFMNNVNRLSPLALMMVGSMIPSFYDPNPVDFSKYFPKENEDEVTENPLEKLYNEEYCKIHLPQLLEVLEKMGVFEFLKMYRK